MMTAENPMAQAIRQALQRDVPEVTCEVSLHDFGHSTLVRVLDKEGNLLFTLEEPTDTYDREELADSIRSALVDRNYFRGR